MKHIFIKAAVVISLMLGFAVLQLQANRPLTYFLEDIPYDDNVPSPEDFLGYQPGEWHIQHALMVQYMERIAETSERAMIYEYGRTYEHRPLVHLVITSEENQRNLDEIQANHLALTDPERSADLDVSNMPAVVRLGYGVHGNEQSAHNAAPLVAYYLAAGQSAKVQELLENVVIVIDPSLNPDGQDRFASWVNRNKSKTLNPDPNDREFRDVWPGSRTNHYWFDLNRDWLPVQHPESRGRVEAYHEWMPNINTDHHEFGSSSTFFFQPGEPLRVNPRTPDVTDELTMEVGKYHAKFFDEIGQTYYTQQGFDDFYYGKGSTYPDVQGSIGILFEQASTRGHLRETIHGVIPFAQTIRNQVLVSMSSLEASLEMRETLLEHLRRTFASAVEEAEQDDFEAWIFGDSYDQGKNYHLHDILKTHQVDFYDISESVHIDGQDFEPGSAWVVPLKQKQYRLIQSMFERMVEFEDSLFYDVSTWTLPYAFNMPYGKVSSARQLRNIQDNVVEEIGLPEGRVEGGESHVAYLFEWDDYYAPKALYYLQNQGLRTHVATEPFTMPLADGPKEFNFGSIMVPVQTQDIDQSRVYEIINEAAAETGITIHPVRSSLVDEGINLGSGSFASLRKPEVLMLIGSGTSSSSAGEVWHMLDQRFHMPVTKVELDRISSTNLNRYNVIVMVSGSFNGLGDSGREALSDWVRSGGTIVAVGSANRWLERNDFIDMEFLSTPDIEEEGRLPYYMRGDIRGARRISGSIFMTSLDTTHPVGYGYRRESLPVYVSGTFGAKPNDNPFANPVVFNENSLVSGYVWEPYLNVLDGSSGVQVNRSGRGTVVSIIHNPNFRGFWFGNSKLFMNSLFFGQIMGT
ncbi:MAG: M14 family zinc carboxypeptidase [Bacteroidales bacterium]